MARRPLDAETVLDAAERLADEQGFDQLTLRGVARAVGVRPPSLYNHLPGGLRDLRDGLRGRGVRLLADELEAALAPLDVDLPTGGEAAVRHTVEAMRRFAETHPGLYEAVLPGDRVPAAAPERDTDHDAPRDSEQGEVRKTRDEAAADGDVGDDHRDIATDLAAASWRVTTLLRRVSEAVGYRDAAATHHARMLRAAIDGCIDAERRGAWAPQPPPQATVAALVRMLSTPPTDGSPPGTGGGREATT